MSAGDAGPGRGGGRGLSRAERRVLSKGGALEVGHAHIELSSSMCRRPLELGELEVLSKYPCTETM